MTGETRRLLREERDQQARARLAASAPPQRVVVRKAEKARRAQEAREVVADLWPRTERIEGRCAYCGAPATGRVCRAHADLDGAA